MPGARCCGKKSKRERHVFAGLFWSKTNSALLSRLTKNFQGFKQTRLGCSEITHPRSGSFPPPDCGHAWLSPCPLEMFTMTETPLRERKMTEDRDYSLFFRVKGSSIHYWSGGICEPCHIIRDYVYRRASLWLLTQLEGEISQLNQITPPHIQPTPSLWSFTQARTLHLLLLILNVSQKHSPSCVLYFPEWAVSEEPRGFKHLCLLQARRHLVRQPTKTYSKMESSPFSCLIFTEIHHLHL